jgi:elongation factor Ts
VAATAPQYVSTEEISAEEREAEKRVFEEKAREEGKPDDVVEKIVEGQLAKWGKEVALLDQQHVNAEKHESKSIEELRQELAAKTGENIRIARFAYFRVGL